MNETNAAIAIIPARGGSRRIPRKNVRNFLGKPIIARVIEVLTESGLFARVVVSTDDDEIADVSARHGALVPFRRPVDLSDDAATTDAVLLHALAECDRVYGRTERACCVYPTSPFISAQQLGVGLDMLVTHHATSAFPVVKYDFPIEQAFVLDGVRPRARWPEMLLARSQDLVDHYHDAGMFYWVDVAKYVQARELFNSDSVAFPVSNEVCQDINTTEDWARAEMKFRMLGSSISS
jgi:pseudaminic acid cytidylyltransferase